MFALQTSLTRSPLRQQAHDRLRLVAVLDRRRKQDAHVLVADRAATRLASELRAFDARGRRARQDSPLGQIGVERPHRRELASHGRRRVPRPAVGRRLAIGADRRRQPVAVAIDVWARRLQRMLAPGRHPTQEDRKVRRVARTGAGRALRGQEVVDELAHLFVRCRRNGVEGHRPRFHEAR
jgi:hypothetical protein